MRSLNRQEKSRRRSRPDHRASDVRRMLMTQKAITEGQRAFLYWCGQLVARITAAKKAKETDDLLGLLTPIAKAFCTESAIEVCNLGVQVFGGHGYIHEHGMEQNCARCAHLHHLAKALSAFADWI